MLRGVLPENFELGGHLLPDDVPPVAEVLEGLDPDDARPLDGAEEDAHPPPSGAVEEAERQTQHGRREDDPQLEEPVDVLGGLHNGVLAGLLVEAVGVDILELDGAELPVVEDVVDRGAGNGHQGIFESIHVQHHFSPISSNYRHRLHDSEGNSPHTLV